MAEAQLPKLRFNCYLIREGISHPEMALRSKYRPSGQSMTSMSQITSSANAPEDAVAYSGAPSEKPPKWAERLDSLFPGTEQITNRSNRFVIFLPVRDRGRV